MIASLTGTVTDISPQGVVLIDVGGVGYEVVMSFSASSTVTPGEPTTLRIHHHIREDAQVLYGFLDPAERATFRILIATHGVGPALALAILGVHRPTDLVDHVGRNDVKALTAVPGVGPKTAERLLVELRNRLSIPDVGLGSQPTGVNSDVRGALEQLGYSASEVNEVLTGLPAGLDASATLREALSRLAGHDA